MDDNVKPAPLPDSPLVRQFQQQDKRATSKHARGRSRPSKDDHRRARKAARRRNRRKRS